MAQLSTIVSSILRDMVFAQHQANMYAVSLEDIYSKDGRLENFAMPAIALGEMEMELRYGIKDSSAEVEQFEINYPALRETAKRLSRSGAGLLVGSAVSVFGNSLPDSTSKGENYFGNMERNLKLKRDYSAFLSHKILKSLQNVSTALINEDGTVNVRTLRGVILNVAEEHLLHLPEVEELLDRNGKEDLLEKVRENLTAAVEEGLPAIITDVNLKRKRIVPSVDVVVESEELAKLPEDAVHSLRFRISPHNIRLYMKDE